MQRGTIIKQNNRWCLRYYENVLRGSDVVRKKSFKVLAPIGKDYPTTDQRSAVSRQTFITHQPAQHDAGS